MSSKGSADRREGAASTEVGNVDAGDVDAAAGNVHVGIIMGSRSDWPTLEHSAQLLEEFEVPYEAQVVSAHRTPQLMAEYAQGAVERGLRVIIAGAGGAAHLPGMVAAQTTLPVLGVPIKSRTLQGVDSLLSIVQMPAGIPVATLAIGDAGAKNAALLAVSILALGDSALAARLEKFREDQTRRVMDDRNLEVGQ